MTQTQPAAWTILRVLRWTTSYFHDKGVAEPRASAEVLLAHVLGVSRLELYLRHDQPLSPEELARFKSLIIRRRHGEPVAYLTGHKEFWSLDFLVSPAVLIPRPETEVLVESVVGVLRGRGQGPRALGPFPQAPPPASSEEQVGAGLPHLRTPPLKCGLEVGVGSGAVVVALAKEIPEFTWVAVDLSGPALKMAHTNARRHGVAAQIRFLQGNLLSAFSPGARFSLLVANLPYVSTSEWEQLPHDIRDFEPPAALLAGPDGLALLRPLAQEAHRYLTAGGWLALEVGTGQAQTVSEILSLTSAYELIQPIKDYSGLNRVVLAKRR